MYLQTCKPATSWWVKSIFDAAFHQIQKWLSWARYFSCVKSHEQKWLKSFCQPMSIPEELLGKKTTNWCSCLATSVVQESLMCFFPCQIDPSYFLKSMPNGFTIHDCFLPNEFQLLIDIAVAETYTQASGWKFTCCSSKFVVKDRPWFHKQSWLIWNDGW